MYIIPFSMNSWSWLCACYTQKQAYLCQDWWANYVPLVPPRGYAGFLSRLQNLFSKFLPKAAPNTWIAEIAETTISNEKISTVPAYIGLCLERQRVISNPFLFLQQEFQLRLQLPDFLVNSINLRITILSKLYMQTKENTTTYTGNTLDSHVFQFTDSVIKLLLF
jgi:hypothetical protein